jgi:protease-4
MVLRTSLPAAESIVKKSRLHSSYFIDTDSIVMDEASKRGATMSVYGYRARQNGRPVALAWICVSLLGLAGCGHVIPIAGTIRGEGSANVTADATVRGAFEVKMPSSVDPGNMVGTVVRDGHSSGPCARIALIDVDGLLLNQNFGSLVSIGDNPLSALRDKLDAASRDPRVAAVVLRINSPGGSVTTCDIMAEELRRFRAETHKPVVACLMDLATAGAYFVAVESDRIVAHPTALTGGLGVVFNHYNLQDAMAQLNLVADPIKSGAKIDMGTVTAPLDDDTRKILQQMADAYRDHLHRRVKERRPAMTVNDHKIVQDGRVLLASTAQALHLVDRLGYVHDAIAEAEALGGVTGAEVVLFHRTGYPAHSLYAITPTPAPLNEAIPFSYPGLDRSKLPTFLYLWQPDPTLPRLGTQ